VVIIKGIITIKSSADNKDLSFIPMINDN
jgi:hypothetical protein